MNAFLGYLLESALCLALFYAAYWLLLRKETTFVLNRFYLLASLALSLVIPLWKVPSPFRTITLPAGPIELVSFESHASMAHRPDFVPILTAVYVLGAALFLARFVLQLGRLYRLIRHSEVRDIGGLRLVSVERDFAPFSFLRYVFLNAREFDPHGLRHVLVHERAHVRQRHSLDILFVEGVTVLQWFNPIVRPYKRSIQETHEFLADGEVIAQGLDAAGYRRLVLEQQSGFRLAEIASSFNQSRIKRRIQMMSRMRSKGAARLKALVLLPLAMLLVLALAQPRLVRAAAGVPPASGQEASQADQTKLTKDQLVAQATENLAILKKLEATLEKSLETAKDPDKTKEIQAHLELVRMLRAKTEAYIKAPDTTPPPPPLPPPAPRIKIDQKIKMLLDKEADLKNRISSETDAAVLKELNQKLAEVEAAVKELKANGGKDKDKIKAPKAVAALEDAETPEVVTPALPETIEAAPAPPALASTEPVVPTASVTAPVASTAPLTAPPALAPVPERAGVPVLAKAATPRAAAAALPAEGPVPIEGAAPAAMAASTPPALASCVPAAATAPTAPPALTPAKTASPEDEEKLRTLEKKELDLRAALAAAQDPAARSKLEDALKQVTLKRLEISKELEAAATAQAKEAYGDVTLKSLEIELYNLNRKEKDIQALIETTQDPKKLADLKDMLVKVQLEEKALNAKIDDLRKAREK